MTIVASPDYHTLNLVIVCVENRDFSVNRFTIHRRHHEVQFTPDVLCVNSSRWCEVTTQNYHRFLFVGVYFHSSRSCSLQLLV